MVGFTHLDIEMLKTKGFILEKVPECSPLHGGLEMTLTIHSESKVNKCLNDKSINFHGFNFSDIFF